MPTIKELTDSLASTLKVARDIAADAEAKARDFTAEERTIITKAMEDANGIKAKITAAKADTDMAASLKAMGHDLGLTGAPGSLPTTEVKAGARTSVGAQFVGSTEYKSMLAAHPNGQISESAGVRSQPFGVKALVTGLSDTSAGAMIQSDWLGIQDRGTMVRPLTVTDIITVSQTDSDTIDYARITGFTNNAAPVAEATTAGPQTVSGAALVDAAGSGVKPESAMTFDRQTTTVKTLAHWMPVTKRALSDASQIRGLIDEFLRYGLLEELEDQIVMGVGTGENFTGINSTSGIQTQAWDTDIITVLRKARSKVLGPNARRRPNAILMNPADGDSLALLKDGNGQYVFGGPAIAGGATQVWGMPIVESEIVPTGFAFVGDFRRCVLWNREQTTIQVSDSHSNFFVRNIVAILAEMRAAFTCLQPAAIVKADIAA